VDIRVGGQQGDAVRERVERDQQVEGLDRFSASRGELPDLSSLLPEEGRLGQCRAGLEQA
jgi:hypothetical protein